MFTLWQLSEGWQWFFHRPEAVASLCVFRIGFGALLAINALVLINDAQVLLGPRGLFPYKEFSRSKRHARMTLFRVLPDSPATVGWIVVGHLVASLMMMVGCCTTVSAGLAWVTLTSLHHRSMGSFHGGDTVMRSGRDLIAALSDAPGSPWALRLMQIQLSIIYLWTTHWKLRGEMWRNGTAVYYAVQNKSFQRVSLPRCLLQPLPMRLAAYATLVIEGALGTLIWVSELRHPLVLAGLALHIGIEYCMNLQLFGWTMCCCLLLFVSPELVVYCLAFIFS
jgi:hypothetical protein